MTRLILLVLCAILAACNREPAALPGPYGKEVAKAIPLVEDATGMKFKSTPTLELRSRDELRGFLASKFNEDKPALELASQEQAYRLFGLLPDTLELRPFYLSLLSEQVAGYYDPAKRVLYVISGGAGSSSSSALAPEVLNTTITHELIHANQDQYFPLDSITKGQTENDRAMAIQAVIEGSATYETFTVMLGGGNMLARLPGGWDRVRQTIRDSQGQMPVLGSAPMFIQETLLFPYLSGAEFTRRFKEKRPGQSPLSQLPTSTEQVLHPEKLLDSLDSPLAISLPRPMSGSVVYENGLGEFETRLFLHQHVKDVTSASRGATGWGGDRYLVVRTAQGAAMVWVSIWDSKFDAAEFRFVLAQAVEKKLGLKDLAGGTGDVLRYNAKGRSVEVRSSTVQGRPAILYVDAPAGAGTNLIDLSRVKVSMIR